MQEIKNHPYLNCKVSNNGEIYSIQNKSLKGFKDKYHRVTVKTFDKKSKTCSVHRLVVETFISLIPENMIINHIDGNKLNNNFKNLEIVTYKQNTQHAVDTGLIKKMEGEKNGNSKLKEKDVLQIYDLVKKGYNNTYIANIFNLNFRTISQIRTGFRWSYLFKIHMNEIIKSHSLKTNNLDNNLKLINEIIKSSKSNITLSKEYNLEASMISRIKNKKTWLQIWNLYNRSATTISKESTL